MDKSEYWILDSAVHYTSPIDILAASEEAIFEWFGSSGPGLARADLVDAFHRLFQSGYLAATRTDKERFVWIECFVPSKEEIEAGLSQEIYFDYGLTAKGGSRWETYVNADWSKFFQIEGGTRNRITLVGSNKKLISSALDRHAKSQGCIIVNPIWEVVQPWSVTYWKTLPVGHRLTYGYRSRKSKPPFSPEPHPPFPKWYVEP